jgi:hypothetical protein
MEKALVLLRWLSLSQCQILKGDNKNNGLCPDKLTIRTQTNNETEIVACTSDMRSEKSNQRIRDYWIGIFSEVEIIQNKIIEENITVTSRILNDFFILKNLEYMKLFSLLEETEWVIIIISLRKITF